MCGQVPGISAKPVLNLSKYTFVSSMLAKTQPENERFPEASYVTYILDTYIFSSYLFTCSKYLV